MPLAYRIKICPSCGVRFRGLHLNCSYKCKTYPELSEESKRKVGKGFREYRRTPEGIAKREQDSKLINYYVNKTDPEKPIDAEDWAVVPPSYIELRDVEEYVSGFERGESW